MPRILRIFNRMIVGGPVLNASYLTRYLQPEFETLMVVGPKDPHEQDASYLAQKLGIEVHTIPEMGRSVSALSDVQALLKLRQLIRTFRPDVVHTHAAKPGALGRVAAASMGVPAIVHTYHGHVFHSYFNRFKTELAIRTERWLARHTHAIIAISPQQQQELVQDFRIAPAHKFRQIHLGLDLDPFTRQQVEKRTAFRASFGLAPDEVAIGIIGRLVPVKNHDLFLQGLYHVLRHSTQRVKAFIIGDGETRGRLEAVAASMGIAFSGHTDAVHPHPLVFASWRKDMDTVMAGLDIVALTSFNEGTPVSLIEAQAAGKAIVATRVGGVADVVADNASALLCAVGDVPGFGAHLLRLVEDASLRLQIGGHSRQRVLEQFGYQRMVRETADLYHHLLDQKKPHVVLQTKARTAG